MYNATEVFVKCPKGCDANLIKCSPDLFICPKCESSFIHTSRAGGTKFYRKTSEENANKCLEILHSENYGKLKTIDREGMVIKPPKNVEKSKITESGFNLVEEKREGITAELKNFQEAVVKAKEVLDTIAIVVESSYREAAKRSKLLSDKINSLLGQE